MVASYDSWKTDYPEAWDAPEEPLQWQEVASTPAALADAGFISPDEAATEEELESETSSPVLPLAVAA